jgi:hypothetical protein
MQPFPHPFLAWLRCPWTAQATLTCTTACEPTFLAAAQQMLADKTGQTLYAYVNSDYAARWQGLTPPTLADCKAFVNAVTLK